MADSKPINILGIDPGTRIMGYGLISVQNKKAALITMGILKLSSIDDHYVRLQKIFNRTLNLIDEFNVDELAIEAPFYGKNVQSMLKLGRAQGVAIAAAAYRSLPVYEYAPRKIKIAVTGQGAASKEQVALFIEKTLQTGKLNEMHDATDGLATAMCHFYKRNSPVIQNGYKGWDDFLSKNPGKRRK